MIKHEDRQYSVANKWKLGHFLYKSKVAGEKYKCALSTVSPCRVMEVLKWFNMMDCSSHALFITRQAKLREPELDTIELGVTVNLGSSPAVGQHLTTTWLPGSSEDKPPLRLMSALPCKHLEDLVLNEMGVGGGNKAGCRHKKFKSISTCF